MYIYTIILIDMEQIFSTDTYQERSEPAPRQGADRSIAAEAERFEASSPVVTTRGARVKTSGNWVVVWNISYFPIYIWNNHPN